MLNNDDQPRHDPQYSRALYSAVQAGLREAHDAGAMGMLKRVQASLEARAAGRNAGGDTGVMATVDAIVKRESASIVIEHRNWTGFRPPALGAVQSDAFGGLGSGLTDAPPVPKSGLDSLTPDLNRVRPGGPGPVEVHSWWCPQCGAHLRSSDPEPTCPWVGHSVNWPMRRQENPNPVYDEVGPGAEIPLAGEKLTCQTCGIADGVCACTDAPPCTFCNGTGLGASERESCQMCGGSGEQTEVTV